MLFQNLILTENSPYILSIYGMVNNFLCNRNTIYDISISYKTSLIFSNQLLQDRT